MQNKSSQDHNHTPGQFPLSSEIQEKVLDLETRIKKLGDICNELNPYQPVDAEFKLRLREFNIMEFEDPFKITNALLMLLEDSIDELHELRPLSPEELLKENYR